MQNISRFCAFMAPLLAVGACAGLTQSQATQDVQTLAAGVASLGTALSAVPGVPADVIAKVEAEDAIIQKDAAAIGTAATPSANIAADIDNAVGVISTLVTPFFPEAPAIAAVVEAAASLGQVIVQETGATPAVSISASRAMVPMTPNQARRLLNAHPLD